MARRYRILVVLGILVFVLDQWTKYLAVAHLTPGVANMQLASQGAMVRSREEQKRVLEEMSFLQGLRHHFTRVETPCAGVGALCPEVKVIDGFWSWRYVENRGAAFSAFAGWTEYRRPFLLVVAIAALAFVIQFIRKLSDEDTTVVTALSLVFGGAVGNFLDRLRLGYVVDFVDWYSGTYHWPTFNVADTGISVGLGLMALASLLDYVRKRNASAARAAGE